MCNLTRKVDHLCDHQRHWTVRCKEDMANGSNDACSVHEYRHTWLSKSIVMIPHALMNAPDVFVRGPTGEMRAGPKHDCVIVLLVRLYVGSHGGSRRLGMAGGAASPGMTAAQRSASAVIIITAPTRSRATMEFTTTQYRFNLDQHAVQHNVMQFNCART